MNTDIIRNKKDWKKLIKDWKDDRGTKIYFVNDQSEMFGVNQFKPKKFPFLCITGDYVNGCTFDHQDFIIIYKDTLIDL